jgi:hypothetical protein
MEMDLRAMGFKKKYTCYPGRGDKYSKDPKHHPGFLG